MYSDKSLTELAGKFIRLLTRSYAFPPRDLAVELSTACDADCGMCFRNTLKLEPATMPLSVFKKIAARLREAYGEKGPAYVNFVGLGEIRLNPDLPAILEYFKKTFPGAAANISTNLLAWDEPLFRRILTGRLASRISISIDDTAEAGPAYHGSCAGVAANIKKLSLLNAELGFPTELRLQAVMISRPQALRVLALAAKADARIVNFNRLTGHGFPEGRRPARPGPSEEKDILRAARARGAELGLQVWNNNTFNFFMDLASDWDRFCLTTDDHLFIDVEGRAAPCFCLRHLAWGSVLEKPLSELYREKPDFYAMQPEACGGCDVYKKGRHNR